VSTAEPASDFAGDPDCFGRLWTPYRMAYIQGADRPTSDDAGVACPFCRAQSGPDADALVVRRGELMFAVMNLYPYSPGHLLICPYRHVALYTDLTLAEVTELATMTQAALRTIAAVSGPAGFNLGLNQGAVAGAGIAGHLHQHVVPRWAGDTNFLPIIARTRAIPQLLEDTRTLLADNWVGVRRP